jgi:hypothetical protein
MKSTKEIIYGVLMRTVKIDGEIFVSIKDARPYLKIGKNYQGNEELYAGD